MKLRISPKNGVSGNTLTATLFSTVIIGFVLASYMTLVSSLNYKNMRSQAWNSAISVIEAGIEEALTHLNVNGITNLDKAGEGWTKLTNGDYYKRGDFGGQSRFEVTITPNINPVIVSRGFVPVPENNIRFYNHFFATTGLTQDESNPLVRRTVRVTASKNALFVKAMVARDTIDINGNNVETDSFDSTDPDHSTNGRYDVTKRKDNGDVASNTNIINSVNVGNANIYGRVSTGPGGSVAVGANGAVGSAAWHDAGNNGTQPGYFTDDMNVSFPVVDEPFDGGGLPPEMGVPVVTTDYNVTTAEQISTGYPDSFNGSVLTNTQTITTSVYPDPVPPGGVSTNIQTVFTTSRTYPEAGTYVGTVTTREVTDGPQSGRGTWYDFNKITGYEYNYTAVIYNYWTSTTNITYFTNTYAYALGDGNYSLSSLIMSGNDTTEKTMIVTGDAVLYVTGDVSITGNASIVIAPGASLKLYVAGSSAKLLGNGVINETGYAHNFMYYGLPSNSSLELDGNGEILAAVYAPDTDFTLGGGGSGELDFVGASVTKTVKLNGHFKFHYDEFLSRWGPDGKYVVTSWDEVDNNH
jgi:hypothetical protein